MTETAHNLIACTKCGMGLPWDFRAGGVSDACPACDTPLQVEVFPALFSQPAPVSRADAVIAGDEAACFFHPEKKAVVPCGQCGRFLCALCDLHLGGEHLCPSCLESARKKRAMESWETRRVLYDSIALYLAVLPPLLFITVYFTPITAPAAVFLAIFTWKKPSSVIPRTKARAVCAIVFGLLQIAGIAALIYAIVHHLKK